MRPAPENRDPHARKQSREENRNAKEARGECRECSNPVAIKRNGKPAKVCATHLEADRKRKKAA